MKRYGFLCLFGILLFFVIFSSSYSANEGKILQVVASTKEMAHFAKQIGGDRVEVYPIFRGQMDIHFFQPRPSHIVKLRNAEMLVIGGLAQDVWIQPLIDASRNSKIRFKRPGYVDPAHGVRPLQRPSGKIDGSMGDVHPFGNPHYWLTLPNVRITLENIFEGLYRNSPEDKAYFTNKKNAYLERVEETFLKLRNMLEPYRGTKVVQYHWSWDYFCKYFGLELAGSIEPKPGIPPSPSHLEHLIKVMRAESVQLILAEPYYPDKPINYIASQTQAKVLRLPIFLGGGQDVDDFLNHLTKNVEEIVNALKEK